MNDEPILRTDQETNALLWEAVRPLMTKKTRLDDLLEAAASAADWLCEARIGTDPYERGIALRLALERLK